MNTISPALMFDSQAEEAARLYVSVFSEAFGNSEVLAVTRYGEKQLAFLAAQLPPDQLPGPPGRVQTVRIRLDGKELLLANGGPYFRFTEGISLLAVCKTQAQIDLLSKRLSEGGEIQPCGWLKDRFGVSWQINSDRLQEMIEDPDTEKSQRVSVALYGMKKIDLAALERAYAG